MDVTESPARLQIFVSLGWFDDELNQGLTKTDLSKGWAPRRS